jgi:hypothetical protein
MNAARVETIGAGVDSVLHLPDGRVEKPAFKRDYAVRDGVLVALDPLAGPPRRCRRRTRRSDEGRRGRRAPRWKRH